MFLRSAGFLSNTRVFLKHTHQAFTGPQGHLLPLPMVKDGHCGHSKPTNKTRNGEKPNKNVRRCNKSQQKSPPCLNEEGEEDKQIKKGSDAGQVPHTA